MSDDKKKRGRPRRLTDSARKRRRSVANSVLNKYRIYIGNQFDRWSSLKDEIGAQTSAEVAKVLLDRYYENMGGSEAKTTIVASTPVGHGFAESAPPHTPCLKKRKVMSEPEFSGISSSDQEPLLVDSEMSGVDDVEMPKSSADKTSAADKSSSFINPFEISIDTSGNFDTKDDSLDEDYEPSFFFTIRPEPGISVEDEEEEEGDEEKGDNQDDESDGPELDLGPGVRRMTTVDIDSFLSSDNPFLVYKECLLNLANTQIKQRCNVKECKKDVEITTNVIGSAMYILWVCQEGHVLNKWCSQPLLNRRLHSGDLMLAAATLLSGNNYQKISAFANALNLPIVGSSTFHKIQRNYLVPSVDQFWVEHQADVLRTFRDRDVVVLGDGRMDSPGHSAQYCSYTFMEMESKTILCIITLDKRMTEKKSTNLEKACFERGMKFLKDEGIKVVEVVTDAHCQIEASMKKPQYANIKHSFDIWHGTKNLGKKIIKVLHEKGKKNKALLDWTKDIVNHYWHCASISNTVAEFQTVWYGILHHVVDEHEWLVSYDQNFANSKCNHGPLQAERDKPYMEKGSPAHNALRRIIMDKRLVNHIHYYLRCRSTSDLETFQNLILTYASKRHAYTPPVYRVRNRLAALDHNVHLNRSVLTKEDGSQRWRRIFNKKSSRWSAQPVKEKKTFLHIPHLLRKIITLRLEDRVGMNRKAVLEPDDPRRLSKNLAAIPPPPTQEIVQQQRSRFGVDFDKTIDYTYE